MSTHTYTTLQNRFRRRLDEESETMTQYARCSGPERAEHLRRSKRLRTRIFRLNSLMWGNDVPARLMSGRVIAL